MLNCIIAVLKNKNIEVHFIQSVKDDIEIGELKNGRITLNTDSRDDLSLVFTIAHLFGHYIQFRNYSKYKHLVETVEQTVPLQLSENFKQDFFNYEKEAYGIGKSLMNDSFPVTEDIDQKYQSFMITDFEHFWHYITTGHRAGLKEFNKLLNINYANHPKFENPINPILVPDYSKEETITARVTIF